MQDKLIEHAFPLKQASMDSVHEKNVRHGHISTLHIWPARRPLAACRAAIIATLLPDPGTLEARQKLCEKIGGKITKKIIKKKMPNGGSVEHEAEETTGGILHWGRETENAGVLAEIKKQIKKAYNGKTPRVLDPFSGGGAIPLEAMRLGCEATAVDLNPVAWFILKCTLEYPQQLAGETLPLPEFILENEPFMEEFYAAHKHLAGRTKPTKKQLAAQKGTFEETKTHKEDNLRIPKADLAWHVRAWGQWVLKNARKELATFYPAYADYETVDQKNPKPFEKQPTTLCPLDADGNPDIKQLNDGLSEDYLRDKTNPRWVAKETIAYLWARTVQCKNCRSTVPLLKTRWLCKKEKKRVLLEMKTCTDGAGTKTVEFSVNSNVPPRGGNAAQNREHDKRISAGTMSRNGAKCPCCGAMMSMEDIRLEGKNNRLGNVMTAVVVNGQNGKEYRRPFPHEIEMAQKAEAELEKVFAEIPFGLPEEEITEDAKRNTWCVQYGVNQWYKLFTPRQLLALGTFVKWTRKAMSGNDRRVIDGKKDSENTETIRERIRRKFADDAVPLEEIPFSPKKFREFFGREMTTDTPLGKVKIGEHQYQKLAEKKRENLLWAMKQTLSDPIVVLNEKRETGNFRLYIKSFRKTESPNYATVMSVVVTVENVEVSVSTYQRKTREILMKITDPADIVYEKPTAAGRKSCGYSVNSPGSKERHPTYPLSVKIAKSQEDSSDNPADLSTPYPPIWKEAVKAYLAVVLDKMLNYMSKVCMWSTGGAEVKQTFGRYALPITWDYGEGNPLSHIDRFYIGGISNTVRVLKSNMPSFQDVPKPNIFNQSSQSVLLDKYDLIITDPPYYDAIGYAALMDFFYVWLRRTLFSTGTNGAGETESAFSQPLSPKVEELIDDASRHGGDKKKSKQAYEDGMATVFTQCYNALTDDGRFVVVFASKNPDAWETLVAAVIRSGFIVTASWPIATEMTGGMRNYGRASLASSVWLVCKKRSMETKAGWDKAVMDEMRKKIREHLRNYWDSGIRGPDFVWAATGPAMEAFSKYPAVRKLNEDGLMTMPEFLSAVRRIVVEYVVGRVLSGEEGDEASLETLDDVTAYYLLHRHDFNLNDAPAGACILYALSCGLSDRELASKYNLIGYTKGQQDDDEGESGDSEADTAEEMTETSGNMIRLKTWAQRKSKSLGQNTGNDKGVPLIDRIHCLMHLWRGGDADKVDVYLDENQLRSAELFKRVMQSIIELSPAGSDERALLESISNHVGGRKYRKEAEQLF